jgi:hypothetical protein
VKCQYKLHQGNNVYYRIGQLSGALAGYWPEITLRLITPSNALQLDPHIRDYYNAALSGQ